MPGAGWSPDEFLEVFVDTPLAVAEERDPKGMYKRARRGELANFTGVDSRYEAPTAPDVRIETTTTSPEAAAQLVIAALRRRRGRRPHLLGERPEDRSPGPAERRGVGFKP